MAEHHDAFRAIAFPLEGFTFPPASNDCGKQPDHLFVGRTGIIDKLVDLLKSNRKRGSYLIAGYRGAGKTTVINKAITKYRAEEKRRALVVRINLGDTSQLTPLSIYYSIVNILREELTDKSCHKWERRLESSVSFKAIAIYISLLVAVLIPMDSLNLGSDLPVYYYVLWLAYFLGLLKGAIWSMSRLRYPELASLTEIDDLIERISNEISEGRTADFRRVFFGFGLSKQKKRLPIKAREAEEVLFRIFKRIGLRSRARIVIVLDEIDKLSDSEELSEVHDHDGPNVLGTDKIGKINTLLGSLKNFITTAEATFFFVSGRETLDRYYSEKGSSNSLYESLFDRVFELPSLLTDQGDLPKGNRLSALVEEYVCRRIRRNRPGDLPRGNRLSALVEEYICRRIRRNRPERIDIINNETKLNYYSLTAYRDLVKTNPILSEGSDGSNADEQLRQGINTLRNFIHYLTFHSWGNPKRLSSLFENFIVLNDEDIIKSKSTLKIGKNGVVAKHWLVFTSAHQRSFSFASELTTLFSHQLGREVSKMSDKLTVSTLSSLHYILKLHHYGFTRESLSRMAEAINVYRSTELNTIIDDLLTHVFKSYIRRIRNGVYRYRFNSAFEQELRYLSHGSELESATYNFSLDSMRNVKQVFEDISASSKDTHVIARSHITLGDIYAVEQSYTAASVHYSTASRLLTELLNQSPFSVNLEILMQCVEAMIKHGDLEERRQNYNLAAAIYFEADCTIRNLDDLKLRGELLRGDSKLDLLKQPFWALQFLSLKRSPRPYSRDSSTPAKFKLRRGAYEFENPPLPCEPPLPAHLYENGDPRFHFRAANLSFFLGEGECASYFYLEVLRILKEYLRESHSHFPNERAAYLGGKARVGLAESALIFQSHQLYKIRTMPSKGERQFAAKLLEAMSEYSYIYHRIGKPLKIAAIEFETNKLYISAATAHIKAICYYTAILDVFDANVFHNDVQKSQKLADLATEIFKKILEVASDAIRCISKARQLETSQSNKTFVMHDLETKSDKHEMTITKLFDMLMGTDTGDTYPVAEPIFWQSSLWAHKLAATLCWAYYVKSKIEIAPDIYTEKIWNTLPENLPSSLAVSGFSVRPAILLRWIWARNLNRKYINRTLIRIGDRGCSTDEALDALSQIPRDVAVTHCGKTVADYIFLLSEEKTIPPTLKKAHLISKYLYLAQESSRIISRKNLDLIFPRLPQIYFAQWKLLLNLILATLVDSKQSLDNSDKKPSSIRDFSLLIQRAFTVIDRKLAPDERIAASHFDYEFIYLRLSESLESSINIVDRTSRTNMSIFQHKYYCHDDHSDPDFQMDFTLAYMFAPRARYLLKEVINTHNDLKLRLEDSTRL